MVKNILKSALAFLGAFFLFAVLANGMNFLLIDSLFAFSGYPRFPATPANPLYVLFPLVFMFFSFPALTLISVQRQFSLKKRFLLLLESHAFFFFWQVLFWSAFCFFTLHQAHVILQFLLGYSPKIDASLTSIFMPLILTRLLPVYAFFFIWFSFRTTLFLLKDEERKLSAPKEDNDNFSFSLKEIERAFTLADLGNVFFLLLVLVIFLPPDYAKYFPKLCSLPVIFLLCPLQYYIVHLYRKEKRKSLLLPGIFLQFFILGITLFLEDSTYQFVFIAYFLIQALAYYYFIRYGKDFFTAQ